jgi:hypothetical protein
MRYVVKHGVENHEGFRMQAVRADFRIVPARKHPAVENLDEQQTTVTTAT